MQDFNKVETGNRIRKLREAAKETQSDLAELLGVKRQIISYYENGDRVPNIEQIIRIASHYNTNADFLLCFSKTPTTDKNIKFICNYTGLKDDVVDNIAHNPAIVEVLNFLLSDERVVNLVSLCVNLEARRRKTAEFTEYKKSVLDNANSNSVSVETIMVKKQEYIDSCDLKEYQTQKVINTIQDLLFRLFNSCDNDVDKRFDELLQRMWVEEYGDNQETE